ncbi:bifunctional folylpolyglutamate synthase/dihydrofolate synthase [Gemmatimonas phototrophica]|uniref:bifunctional folylpolyglutamate synthase/dihydrofolate synthase n=1 Tax=Gemmatimonas phototrophica TaxID=1379270 RepID=UPI0006A6CB34|nr:folylpolyglutamate synthase/dihydrofolate synthase family protein [Gemmatimonas phototrophica]
MSALLADLGQPQDAYPVFHVAGTNGKGSTVATLDALLRGSGLRVGRYTSPHLVDFSERIVIDGVPMSHAAITEWLTRWEPRLTELGATFFEATTAMALSYFAAAGVDVAIVEVGLGGRLDATNVVSPLAAGVTQIGFDHMEFLGETLEAIATEKAGIFKPVTVAVVGDTQPAIREFLRARAVGAGATPVLVTGEDWQVRDVVVDALGTSFTLASGGTERRLTTPLVGHFQAHNTAVALAMLRGAGGRWADIEANAATLLPGVHLAGRFHLAAPWLFDVAHNADGAATVVANLVAVGLPHPITAVVCVLRDKDWRGILTAVARAAEKIVVTMAPTAPANRTWDLLEVESWARTQGLPILRIDDFTSALAHARAEAATVLVTGSFHTVGDAMERLQVHPLAR